MVAGRKDIGNHTGPTLVSEQNVNLRHQVIDFSRNTHVEVANSMKSFEVVSFENHRSVTKHLGMPKRGVDGPELSAQPRQERDRANSNVTESAYGVAKDRT